MKRCDGLRVEVVADGSLGSRIRNSRLVPYQVVIGPQEAAAGLVSVRLRDGRQLDPMPVDDLLAHIHALIDAHSTALW